MRHPRYCSCRRCHFLHEWGGLILLLAALAAFSTFAMVVLPRHMQPPAGEPSQGLVPR